MSVKLRRRRLRRAVLCSLLCWLGAELAAGCTGAEVELPPAPPPVFRAAEASTPPPPEPLNLILVTLDTLRADHLEVYGYDRPTTPMLAARAKDWFVFDNAQSAAPWTAPALATLMTSLYPAAHGVLDYPIPGRLSGAATTLAEVLRGKGYATGAFTEGGYAKGDFGLDQGFDTYPANPGDTGDYRSNLSHPSRLKGNLKRALAWIRRQQGGPFFLFFHTYEPHQPYRAPEEFIRLFRPEYDARAEHTRLSAIIQRWNSTKEISRNDASFTLMHTYHCRLNGMPQREDVRSFSKAVSENSETTLHGAEFRDWITDLYDAEIAYTDSQLESLWSELDGELGEHTIVLLIADHGEGLGEHGLYGHGGVLFEELLHVPLLLRLPGSDPAPRRVAELSRSVDVMPTLLELLGFADRSLVLQGRSLVPLLHGESFASLSFSHGRSHDLEDTRKLYTVRDARWRLAMGADFRRLYDLRLDPAELRDVADQHPAVVARLGRELGWQKQRDQVLRAALSAGDEPATPSAETLEELRQLGYLED